MPRIKKIDRSVKIWFYLPESLHSQLHAHLYSELETRVPYGAMSSFLTQVVSDYFQPGKSHD